MMGFDTDEASVYQIRLRHRHQGVRELIPSDYGGVMHTDRALTCTTPGLWNWWPNKSAVTTSSARSTYTWSVTGST